MDTNTATPAPAIAPGLSQVIVNMRRDKECKGSVRFATSDDKAPITNVYISRAVPGINAAKMIAVAVTIIP